MHALRRIMRMVVSPSAEWGLIAREKTTVDSLIGRYVVPLSLLAPIASMIGMAVFNTSWSDGHGYRVPAQDILAAGATTLFASILSVPVLAGIFVLIAPMYGSSRDYGDALKVATFGTVPVMLAGATLFIPVMAMIGLVALVHSLFLYWQGARLILNVVPGQEAEFVGISMVLLCIVSIVAGAAASGAGLI